MQYPLALLKPELSLPDIALYHMIKGGAEKERIKHKKLAAQVDTIVSKLAEPLENELALIEDLQRQLRLHTKGVPLTESLTPDDREPLLTTAANFNQAQHDALSVILKRIYKKLAQLVHPDKGGSVEAFQEIEIAYKMRDINRLNAIYFTVLQGRDLYWQQNAGLYHVSSEMERYKVEIQMLQQTPAFKASSLYLQGQVNKAQELVRSYLQAKARALQMEINHVIQQNTKGNQNG